MRFIELIQNKYPKSFSYFALAYTESHEDEMSFEQFNHLSFMFQLGIYISFFNSVSTDVDIYSNEEGALKSAITEAFGQYEEYLFLDS